MIDWTRGYGVTFEYWVLDPDSFREVRRLYAVEECEITRDSSDDTIESASMTVGELLEAETYIRVYLVATPAGGKPERVALGTFLAIAPKVTMDGKIVERPLEMHSPLKELADDNPPIGYTVREGTNAVSAAKEVFARYHVKVGECSSDATLSENVTASDLDTWLSFGKAVLESAGMEVSIDPYGTVAFAPKRDSSSMAPVWTFADDDISILMPEAELTLDWDAVPNVVEAVCSNSDSTVSGSYENSDAKSNVSTTSRGRVVRHRENNPEGVTTKAQAVEWSKRKLRELSSAEREVSFSHGYCPVRLGDCVRLAYTAHRLDARAKVTRQVIHCRTDLEVDTTGVYTEALWNE